MCTYYELFNRTYLKLLNICVAYNLNHIYYVSMPFFKIYLIIFTKKKMCVHFKCMSFIII